MKILIFGASDDTLKFLENCKLPLLLDQIEIVGITDNDSRLWGKDFHGYNIVIPRDISALNFDKLIVIPIFFIEIRKQLRDGGISDNKIVPYFENYWHYFSRDKRIFGSVTIGRFSYFKPGTKLLNTTIGNFCHIGTNCIIGQGGHDPKKVTTYPLQYHFTNQINDCSKDNTADKKRLNQITRIGNDVYIGEGVVIMAGVSIGNGAVIASRAIVSKDVEDYTIVGGIPAKVITKRFGTVQLNKLKSIQWWNWTDQEIEAKMNQFDMDIENFVSENSN